MTITEFLLARIAEDEADHYCYHSIDLGYFPDERYGCVECGIMDDRKCRTQLECAARRAIIEQAQKASELEQEYDEREWAGAGPGPAEPGIGDVILYALAAVYKDHPDYRQEWAA